MCRQRAGCNPGTARLTARGLGSSCREEAAQQLEGCKGFERLKGLGWQVVRGIWSLDLEGFNSFKRLKPGKRQA